MFILYAMFSRTTVFSDAGLIGLGLTYSISLTGTFLHTIQQSAEIENLVSD